VASDVAPSALLSLSESRAGGRARRATNRWGMLTIWLLALDAVCLSAAFAGAYIIRFKTALPILDTQSYSATFYAWIGLSAVPVWLGLFAVFRLYDRRLLFSGAQEYVKVANACTVGVFAQVVLSFLEVYMPISRGWLMLTWLLSIVLVCSGRFAARRVLHRLRRAGRYRTPTLIVGANEEGLALAEQLMADPGASPDVLGFIDATLPVGTPVLGPLQVVGAPELLLDTLRLLGSVEIVVAATALTRDQLLEVYRTVGQEEEVELYISSGLFEILTTGMQVQEINNVSLMSPRRVRITGPEAVFKTVTDYSVALLTLVLLSPVMAAVALLIRMDSPGPVIFRRRVLGVSGKPFDAFKFRTMIVNAERRHHTVPIDFPDRRQTIKSPRDPRITRIGRALRRTSLDELPQLINVLRGEMSLVGPRMIAPDEAARYGKWRFNLLTVKPGITGPWQVQGRGDIPYAERVRLSMNYIRNYSVWLDLMILVKTVLVVVQRKGAF
jgi:exopolysaccharide biosynthesis polyprenyl glycosylphosphotransferase